MLLALATLAATPAAAHTPHDVIGDVAVSPAFADDATVWAVTQSKLVVSHDGGATWRELHHGVPDAVTAVEVAPGDPSTLYLLAAGGRVVRSVDGGDRWAATATSPAFGISSLAVSPIDPATVLVATRDSGTWLSTDGGDSWEPAGGPTEPTVVAFGAEAALLVGDADGTVHRSVDNGGSWTDSPAIPGAPVTALAAGGDEAVYAGDDGGSIARSDDDGRSFTPAGDLPEGPVASIARSPDHATDGTVWAATAGAGPYRSTDRGRTWEPVLGGITTSDQADATGAPQFQELAAGRGADGPVVFLSGFDGLFRSLDGQRWSAAETLADRIVGIAVSPSFATDRTVVVATYLKGAYLSTDAGATWRPINDGLEFPLSDGNRLAPVRRLLGITFSPAYQRDRAIFSTTWVGFLTWRPVAGWSEVLIGQDTTDEVLLQQLATAVHPDGTIYLGSRWGEVHRSADGGRAGSWEVIAQVGGEVRSILIDPTTGDVWVATTADVYRSEGGTGPFEATAVGASSRAAGWFDGPDSVVFAATPEGLRATRDRGATWEPVAVGTDEAAPIESIGVSPAFADDGLVLVSRRGEGLFGSTDGGETFAPIAPELLAGNHLISDFSNGVSEPIQFSPRFADDGTVFAYSDRVVLRSTDRGRTWEAVELPGMLELLAREAPDQLDLIVTPPGFEATDPGSGGGDATGTWAAVVATAGAVGLAVAVAAGSRRRVSPG